MTISLMIYLTTFLSSIYIAYNYNKNKKIDDVNILFLIIFIITPLVLISALRNGVGTDYFEYKRIFYEIKSMKLLEIFTSKYYIFRTEPLFILLNKIISLFFGYKVFFLAAAIITNYFFVSGILYFKDRTSLMLGMFVYLFMLFPLSFNITRQMIAMSIIFYALKYVLNSDIKKYVFCVICAAMFHNTAIIFIIFYIFSYSEKYKIKRIYIYVMMLALPLIFEFLLPIILKISFFSKYNKYFVIGSGVKKSGIFITFFLLSLPTFFYLNKFNTKETKLWLMSLMYLPIGWVMYSFSTGQRITLYITTLFVYMIPLTFSKVKEKKYRIIIILYYLFMIISYYILQYYILNKGETFPYKII